MSVHVETMPTMTRTLTLLLLLVMAGNSSAGTFIKYYNSPADASAACQQEKADGTCVQNAISISATICNSTAGTEYYRAPTINDLNSRYFKGCNTGFRQNCTITGQTRTETDGQCKCPAGKVVINDACQLPLVQDCPKGQYKSQDNPSCHLITEDCNANTTTGGNFFELTSGTCKSGTGPMTICIGGHPKWCPPFNDCIATGEICSDNVIDVADMNTARPAKVDAAQDKADAAATEAAAAKADAAAAKAAKEAAASQAAADKAAADAVVQSQSGSAPSGPNYLIAVEAAAKASAAQAAAAIAAANAAAQQAIADAMDAIATARKGIIDTGYGTIGGNYAGDIAQEGDDAAKNGRGAAIGGQGGYPPSGQPNAGTGQETGNCTDCAKEATLQSLKAGTGDTVVKQTGNDHFNDQIPTDEATTAKAAYQAKFNEVKTGLRTLFNFTVSADAQLPSFHFGTIKGVDLTVDYNKWSTPLSYVGLMILAFASFIAVRIFLE